MREDLKHAQLKTHHVNNDPIQVVWVLVAPGRICVGSTNNQQFANEMYDRLEVARTILLYLWQHDVSQFWTTVSHHWMAVMDPVVQSAGNAIHDHATRLTPFLMREVGWSPTFCYVRCVEWLLRDITQLGAHTALNLEQLAQRIAEEWWHSRYVAALRTSNPVDLRIRAPRGP